MPGPVGAELASAGDALPAIDRPGVERMPSARDALDVRSSPVAERATEARG